MDVVDIEGLDRAALFLATVLRHRGHACRADDVDVAALVPTFLSYEGVPLLAPLGIDPVEQERAASISRVEVAAGDAHPLMIALPYRALGLSRAWLAELARRTGVAAEPRTPVSAPLRFTSRPESRPQTGTEIHERWAEGPGDLGGVVRVRGGDGSMAAVFPVGAGRWGAYAGGTTESERSAGEARWRDLAGEPDWLSPLVRRAAGGTLEPIGAAGVLALGSAACPWPLAGQLAVAEVETALAAAYLLEPRHAPYAARLPEMWVQAWRQLAPRLRAGRTVAARGRSRLAPVALRLAPGAVRRAIASTRGEMVAEFVRGMRGEGVGLA